MALINRKKRKTLDEIARNIAYIELNAESSFMDEYTGSSFLPHTDLSLFPGVQKMLDECRLKKISTGCTIMAVHLASPGSLATGIGSLPHTDPVKACDEVIRIFPQLPYAPSLPNRGLLENIVFCDSERLPGRVIREGRLLVDRKADLSGVMEQIYLDYIEGNYSPYAVSTEYASGFHEFKRRTFNSPFALKCQVTGPVTFGMQVVDAEKRPVYYDSQYADVLSKLIALRARWLEQSLTGDTGVANTIVMVNEPYLAALGSSVVPIDMDTVKSGWHDIADLLQGSIRHSLLQ